MKRSAFLKHLLATSSLPLMTGPQTAHAAWPARQEKLKVRSGTVTGASHLKLSLNAYSFNEALSKGTLGFEKLLAFCSDQGFDAIDMTGYYFKGYPAVPSDETIFDFKRKAHSYGLAISGTGIRTDFTNDDPGLRAAHVSLVNDWIEVAAKLGAPVLRIFAGLQYPPAEKRPVYTNMVVEHIRQCLPKAKSHGVILGIQNHFDFIKTADEVMDILKALNSEWAGLVLDIGSYRNHDPYSEVEKSIPYAVNWQLKEHMYINNIERPTDLARIFDLINASNYRGYIPIETLGPGDPFRKVEIFAKAVRRIMNELH